MSRILHKDDADLRRQRRLLRNWLAEWRIEQILRGGRPDGLPGEGPPYGKMPAPGAVCEIGPEPGQVWLLPPCDEAGTAERPLYICVVQHVARGRTMIVPFGPFGSPAVSGEWKTGITSKPLRVLCFWNAREIDASMLALAWYSGRVSRHSCEKIAESFLYARKTSNTEVVQRGGFGPPLRHPLDPRHQYLAEESELFEAHVSSMRRVAGTDSTRTEVAYRYEPGIVPLRLAAESRAEYGARRRKSHGTDRRKR